MWMIRKILLKNMFFLTSEKTITGVHFNMDFIFLDVT